MTKPKYRPLFTELRHWARQKKIPVDVPWFQLSHEQHEAVMEATTTSWVSVASSLISSARSTKLHVRVFLSRYRGYATCGDCGGQRLRRKPPGASRRQEYLRDLLPHRGRAAEFFRALSLSEAEREIADKLLEEIQDRCAF